MSSHDATRRGTSPPEGLTPLTGEWLREHPDRLGVRSGLRLPGDVDCTRAACFINSDKHGFSPLVGASLVGLGGINAAGRWVSTHALL
jgi:hypothetical protein